MVYKCIKTNMKKKGNIFTNRRKLAPSRMDDLFMGQASESCDMAHYVLYI